MSIRNAQSNLNFRAAVIVDFKNSGQSCACNRDYDAMKATTDKALVDKKGLIAYEIPKSNSNKYIVLNGAEKEELEAFARALRDNYSNSKLQNAFIKKIANMTNKKGIATIKYTDILAKSSEELKTLVQAAKVKPKTSLIKSLLKKIFH